MYVASHPKRLAGAAGETQAVTVTVRRCGPGQHGAAVRRPANEPHTRASSLVRLSAGNLMIGIPAVILTSRLVPAASSCRLEPTVTAFGPGRE